MNHNIDELAGVPLAQRSMVGETLCLVLLTASCMGTATLRAASVDRQNVSEPTATNDFVVYPPSVELSGSADFQNVLAIQTRADGITVDATDSVQWEVSDRSIAAWDGHRLTPVADGRTELRMTTPGVSRTIPVVVSHAATVTPIRFAADVMPTLTRAGCNTGSCHGAARGKDGFRLSLFGFDPAGDYHRITREMGVRRINLALPAESLLLRKSIGAVPHTGGKLFGEDSVHYQTLLRWLQAGAPADDPKVEPAVVESVAIYPPQAVIESGQSLRFVAVASYADGGTRDLSDLAIFSTNDSSVAPVQPDGTVVGGSRGEALVMARFDTHTVGSQVLTLPPGLQSQPPAVDPDAGLVDSMVNRKLRQLRLPASERCDDATFLRRVSIDIAGRLPTATELTALSINPAADKRAVAIDRLLGEKSFSDIWAMKFSQWLMIRSDNTRNIEAKTAFLYADWLSDQFANNVPIDEVVVDLLTATGGNFDSPQSAFYLVETDPLKLSENVAQSFLGIRTQCAQCHNHPFDRWTMDDYYGFAAFFAQVGRKNAEDYRERIVYDRGGGETKHPINDRVVPPKFLGGETPETKNLDRRDVLAQWLTGEENPFFATNIANRVWAHFMGMGIVDPVDDFRISNPASHPELLEALAQRLIAEKFDLRQLVRLICNSEAYQRSSRTLPGNVHDGRNYASAAIRRIPAETLLDCICDVTDQPDKFPGLPRGSRAVEIGDGAIASYFLTTFGRSARTTVCDCEATTDPSLSQALHLLNGPAVHQKVTSSGVLKDLVAEHGRDPATALRHLTTMALSRQPTKAERTAVEQMLAEPDADATEILQDVFWSILNSREFCFNH